MESGVSLQVGIVGLPNVGKSTLFNALTEAKAESANYPFCTIDPNVGVVTVPDPRLEKICEYIPPQKKIPTVIEFVDIAGLVKGASKGEGLGNQFLANIRETDAITHVVRCFDDPNIIHVAGSVDPLRDIDTIETELLLADLESIEKRLQKQEKQARANKSKELLAEVEVLKKIFDALSNGKPARALDFEKDQISYVNSLFLLTHKPVLYVANVNEDDFISGGNEWTKKVEEKAASEGQKCLLICGAIEAEISQLEEADRKEYLDSMNITEPGLDRLIREAYSLLGLITYFTAGEKEVRAWTIDTGMTAPQAAGKIHTDFEKGFIRAETYHCEDLFSLKTEAAVKEAGKYRSEGKEYIVKDGDVLFFRFNV